MKKQFTLLSFLFLVISFSATSQWNMITTDATADGSNGALLDGTQLEYMHDEVTDSLWFRVTTASMSAAQSMNIGVNIMVFFANPGAGESLFAFWSPANALQYHRLLTTWVTGSAPSNYSGTMGISQGSGVNANNFMEVVSGLKIITDQGAGTIVIGMNRADLIPDDQLGQPVEVISAVGSSIAWNDDILSTPTIPFITLNGGATSSIDEIENADAVRFFPNPSMSTLNIESTGVSVETVALFDLMGREVLTVDVKGVSSIDVSTLTEGVYVVKALKGNEVLTETKITKL